MDRLEAMELLVAVAETGSLTAAGRRLGVPLPTVSRKLAELEAHLGTRLMARSTRRMDLTESGRTYLEACRRILDAVSEAERVAAGEHSAPKGELVLTAPIVFGRLHVLPVVTEFLALYPEIDVCLLLADRNLHLIEDHIDVAVRIGALPDSAMLGTRVGTVRRVVCASPDLLARLGTPKRPQDLAGLPVVTFEGPGSPGQWRFGRGKGRETVVAVRPRLSVNTAEACIDAAAAGVGVTRVLSYQAAGGVADGRLRIVLEAFEPEPLPVTLLHQAQGAMPLKMRSFLDFAVPRLRQRLDGLLRAAP